MDELTTDEDVFEPLVVDGGARYAVRAADGTIANVVLWDGTTTYDPGDGLELVRLPDESRAGVGDRIDPKGRLTKRAKPPELEPTLEERVAALEAQTTD